MVDAVSKSSLSDAAKENILNWLDHEKYQAYKPELEGLINEEEWKTLEDSFFRVLPFGTGGRRGTCGVGSNRINKVTIGETVQALCNYLQEINIDKARVAIAFDSRLTSQEYADYCSKVLAGNGVESFVFDGPRATPELSYIVREMNMDAGIVITASHNPSSDNGIKLYWSDGGQLVAPHDTNIMSHAEKITAITESDDITLVHSLGVSEDEKYWKAASQFLRSDNRDIKIAYSPLHGTGITSVYPVLKKAGFDVQIFEKQAEMNGNFPNVTNNIPNPEVPAANDQVSDFAIRENCDLATTNDPDADRFCILVNDGTSMVQLNGNQAAVLMTDYMLEGLKNNGELTNSHFIASTIVTTDMLTKIAEHYNIKHISNLLVGFKYIGEQIHLLHDEGDSTFVCGGEESYGGVVGDYCRDKDAAGPTAVVVELAAELKKQDKTLLDKLDELYETHGYFHEDLEAISFPGAKGFTTMQNFMDKLRKDTPKEIGGLQVVRVRDYLSGEEIVGKKENVLRLEFSDDGHNRVTIRPSGTEPKIKIYAQTHEVVEDDLIVAKAEASAKSSLLCKSLMKMVEEL
jgi:phosphoglucomutase